MHTIAIIKPWVNQSNLLAQDPLIYKPFLQPDQFALVDQIESHEGEVFENAETQVGADASQYYTIDVNQELFGNLTDDPDSYLPAHQEITSDFTGYPAAMAPAKNFTGYPNAAYTTPFPVLLTTELLHLVEPEPLKDTSIATKDKHFALYYLGYKFWYGMLLFAVYHGIMLIVFYLSKLAKHYSHFPATLQAAGASDW